MSYVSPNVLTKDVRFALSVENREPFCFVASMGVVEQIAVRLGSALSVLQAELESEGGWANVPVSTPSKIKVQKDLMSENVIIEFLNPLGIPQRFQFPPQIALEVAELMKNTATSQPVAGKA